MTNFQFPITQGTAGISVLVYGRNDNHGYNIVRRAALSLNAIAHVLDDGDEILFCDCNTPDELPTFPEAIEDTLTPRCRSMLRIIRIRPAQFRRLAPKTRLKVSEPLCRNVLLRRSRADHRWILSTNTDMLFDLAPSFASLGALARGLDDRLHLTSRHEVPEALWERMDRMNPGTALAALQQNASLLRMDTIVRGDDITQFDGPGDFQLIPRAMLFAMDGFNESIREGWHVDGNLCARAKLATGANGDLSRSVRGFHCDHNRVVTSSHQSSHRGEKISELIQEVTQPGLPLQRDSWGAPNEVFEEIRLSNLDSWLPSLASILRSNETPSELPLIPESYNTGLDLDPHLAMAHLTSHLSTWPHGTRIGWLGSNTELISLVRAWSQMTRHNLQIIHMSSAEPESSVKAISAQLQDIQILIIDGATPIELRNQGSATLTLQATPGPYRDWYLRYQKSLRTLVGHLSKAPKVPKIHSISSQHSWLSYALRGLDASLVPFASFVRSHTVNRKGFFRRLLRLP